MSGDGLTVAIERSPGETRATLIENGTLLEIEHERLQQGSLVDSVHLGRVVRLDPRLGAAFVEIGVERPGFLQTGENALPNEGESVVVQVTQDAVGDKGPTLSRNVGLSGRFQVMYPNRPEVMVSRRISGAERQRLRAVTEVALMGTGHGSLLRTAAAGQPEAALAQDRDRLVRRWQDAETRSRNSTPPSLLLARPGLAFGFLGEALDRGLAPDHVIVDHPELAQELKRWAETEAPAVAERIEVGRAPLFETLGVAEEIEMALERKLKLPGGGFVTIEETEALVAIDVDAPVRHPRDRLMVDLKAAAEIARQLRLRGLGGLVVIDFLRLPDRSDRDRVVEAMQTAVAGDPMAVQVMGWTRSGLFEVIRPRSGPSLSERLTDRGERLKSVATVGLDAMRAVMRAAAANPGRRLKLRAAADVVRWLDAAGRDSRAEAEGRLGHAFEAEVEPGFRRDQLDVVTY